MLNLEKSIEIGNKLREEAAKNGWTLITWKPATHPDDDYIFYTLCERPNKYLKDGKDYCTHLYNNSIGGFHWGHYDIENEDDAFDDFKKR